MLDLTQVNSLKFLVAMKLATICSFVLFLFVYPSNLSSQILYTSDFEADDGGWVGTGEFEWGVIPAPPMPFPCEFNTNGPPPGANSGVSAWGTEIDMFCHSPSTASQMTQSFDFSAVTGPISLNFREYSESGSNGFDMAAVFMNGNQVYLSDGDSGGNWRIVGIDLSILAGSAPPSIITFQFASTAVVERAGWYIDDIVISNTVLPVELSSFTVRSDGSDAILSWETLSERDNSGFEVQMLNEGSWTDLAFVQGAGTTSEAQQYQFTATGLPPGLASFRLKQIDFDGKFVFSDLVEIFLDTPNGYELSEVYPNPFNPSSTFSLAIAESQDVYIGMYNLVGQEVKILHDGEMAADQTQRFLIDGSDLTSGLYLIQVRGATFSETLNVTLQK